MNEIFKKEKNILIATLVINTIYLYAFFIEDWSLFMSGLIITQMVITIITISSATFDIKKVKRNMIICSILNICHANFINMILFIWASESFENTYRKQMLMSHNLAQNHQNKNVTKEFVQPKEKISDEAKKIDILMKIGVFLVILSGVIFSTSNTGPVIDKFKPFFILVLSGIFYGLSYIFKTKVKIKKSEDTYYILANAFVVFFAVALGYFKTFGDFLSFNGEGEKLVYSFIILLTAVVCRNLARKYENKDLVTISYILIYPALLNALTFFEISGIMNTSILLIISFIGGFKISRENKAYHTSRIVMVFALAIYILFYNFDISTSEALFHGLLSIGLLIANLYSISKDKNERIYKQLFVFISVFFINISIYNLGFVLFPTLYLEESFANVSVYSSLLTLAIHHYFVHKEELKYGGFTLTAIILFFNIIMLASNSCNIALFIVSILLLAYSAYNIYKNEDSILQKIYFVVQIFLIGSVIGSGQAILRDYFDVNVVWSTNILLYLSVIALLDIVEDRFITEIKMDLPLYYILIFSISTFSIMFLRNNSIVFNIIFLVVLIAYRFYVNKYIKNQDLVNCMLVLTALLHIEYALLSYIPLYANQILFVVTIIVATLIKKDKITSVFCACLAYLPLIGMLNVLEMPYEVELISHTIALLLIVQLVFNFVLDMPKKVKTILETIFMILILFICIFEVNIYIGLYIGVLSLAMIFLGIRNDKSNSLFYTGIIAMIINIIVQLEEFWDGIPWFVYTLIAGLAIIFYVTYKEFNKDKKPKNKDTKIEYHEEKQYNMRNNFVALGLLFIYIIVTSIYMVNIEVVKNQLENKETETKFEELGLDENIYYFSNKNHAILYIIKYNSVDLDMVLEKTGVDNLDVCWVDEEGFEKAKKTNNSKRYYNNCLANGYYSEYFDKPDNVEEENFFTLKVTTENIYNLEIWSSTNYNNRTRFEINYEPYETKEIEFCINRYDIERYNIKINSDSYESTNEEGTCFKVYDEYGEVEINLTEKPYNEYNQSTGSDDIIYSN